VTASDIIALQPDTVILATGSSMIPPDWLPADVRAEGWVPDVRTAMAEVLRHDARQPGTAVLFDADHTEGTYAAVEALRARFGHVVIVTPRDTIATDVAMTTRQGILRRMAEQRIEIMTLSEPRWSEACAEGRLDIVNVYNGDARTVEDVALLTYSTPRVPNDALAGELRAARIDVVAIGDARAPQEMLFATASGHAAGDTV
jgi:hypothetical protein